MANPQRLFDSIEMLLKNDANTVLAAKEGEHWREYKAN